MGGLPLIASTAMRSETIVPVKADYAVYVDGDTFGSYLAKTIIATDPAVATPVSATEQIKTIQAEKDAYAGQ